MFQLLARSQGFRAIVGMIRRSSAMALNRPVEECLQGLRREIQVTIDAADEELLTTAWKSARCTLLEEQHDRLFAHKLAMIDFLRACSALCVSGFQYAGKEDDAVGITIAGCYAAAKLPALKPRGGGQISC